MHISLLRLQGFRNYASLEYAPSKRVTVLYGKNGAGKTGVLEAMHLTSVGRSHRTQNDREMIMQDSQNATARAQAMRSDGRHDVQVSLFLCQKPQKRVLLSDKPAPRMSDMMGHISCVMFSPEDMRMLRDGPAARRRFVDMQLSAMRPAYLRALKRYLGILEARNALLKARPDMPGANFHAQLETWDEQLAQAAIPVARERRRFIERLSVISAREYASIAESAGETLDIKYSGCLADDGDMKETMLRGLNRAREEDMRRLFTSYGPHRDDMELTLSGRGLQAYGSQGQLRTAVLAMKLAQIEIVEREMDEKPALLLDDVFSELDQRRRKALLEHMTGVQAFVTCTDIEDARLVGADEIIEIDTDEDGYAYMKR